MRGHGEGPLLVIAGAGKGKDPGDGYGADTASVETGQSLRRKETSWADVTKKACRGNAAAGAKNVRRARGWAHATTFACLLRNDLNDGRA